MIDEVKAELRKLVNPEKAAFFPRFFKAGPGEYAEGDQFLGVTVPNQRALAKKYYQRLTMAETLRLLQSPWHEERLTALFVLVLKYSKGEPQTRTNIFDLYLENTAYINNWDLVDSSSEFIVGPWLQGSDYKMKVLEKLARSDSLWERRIAMLATFHYIKQGRADEALAIAGILLHDSHDLIQKAVGWMLREIGKRVHDSRCPARTATLRPPVRIRRMPDTPPLRASAKPCIASPDNDFLCGRKLLLKFLDEHAHDMPRTSLRYAIEHLSPETRKHYMELKNK